MNLLHIVLNDFTRDSRVLRACKVGRELGINVQVYALVSEGVLKRENQQDYCLKRFRPFGKSWKKNQLVLLMQYLSVFPRMFISGVRYKPDIVHMHDLNAIMVGYAIAKVTGAKLIYDSHELWSGSSSIMRSPFFIKNPALLMQKIIAHRADINISVGKHVSRMLEEEFGVAKVHVVRNIPEFQFVKKQDIFRKTFAIPAEKTIILYQGVMGIGRGLENLVSAMPMVKENGVLIFLGDGRLKELIRKQVAEKGLNGRVFFLPAVAPSVLLDYTGSADIGVSPIEPICKSYELSLPNKLFEYIHAGLVAIVSDLPEMASLVRAYRLGRVINGNGPENLAAAINFYLDNPDKLAEAKRNSLQAAKELNWEKEAEVLNGIYRELME